jgi:hypothetical protein
MQEYRASGIQDAVYIPLHDYQVLELLPQDCIVSSRGLVYKQIMTGGTILTGARRGLEYLGESRVDFIKEEAKSSAVE